MGMYNYGIGGNEVKVDANESIAEIPSNRNFNCPETDRRCSF